MTVNASLFESNPVKLAARHPADDILLFAAGVLCLRSEINVTNVRNVVLDLNLLWHDANNVVASLQNSF